MSACSLQGPKTEEPPEVTFNNGTRPPDGGQGVPIINGAPASEYPEAALVNMQRLGQSAICSGAVIAPKVVLTAGHCVSGWTGWDVVAPFAGDQSAAVREGVVFDYVDQTQSVNPDQHDVGLLILETAISLGTYPTLASAPVADGTEVVNIGRIDNGTASSSALFVSPPVAVSDGSSIGFPLAYQSSLVIQSGDSGGPDLLPGSHEIVAVNSGAGSDVQILARVDLVRDWILEQIAASEDGSTDDPPTEDPPLETPPGETPPGETPPGETPPDEDPPSDACGNVTSSGACVGDVISHCLGNSLSEVDCGAWGLTCAQSGSSFTCQ